MQSIVVEIHKKILVQPNAHGCLCKLVPMQKTYIPAQFCQVTTTLEFDMGRGQLFSLVLLLVLLSFILPCQGKPRGGRGGGGRGGGRGGRGGGGWRWFGGSSRGSSYSSGSSYHTTRSYSVVTTPKPTPETILSPTGAGKDKHLDLDFDSLLPILHQSERWTRGDRGLDSILRHTRYVEEKTRYGTTFSSSSTLRRQLTEKKVTLV